MVANKKLLWNIRFLPPCSEGFRRLSIVVALFGAIGSACICFHLRSLDYHERFNQCFNISYALTQKCDASDNTKTESCYGDAARAEERCMKEFYDDNAWWWSTIVFSACLGAYLALLVMRTIGWTIDGFRQKAN
jgi:hypothetical protein